MSLKVFNDLQDVATVATIPESGSFKAAGNYFLSKRDPFAYAVDRILLADGCGFDVFDGTAWRQVVNRGLIDAAAVSLLDIGGAFQVGGDYYIYICINDNGSAEFVISANSTYPAGFVAHNSRKIGGFHYGHIRHVSDDGAWTPVDGNGVKFGTTGVNWKDNVTIGIVPNSVWDLKNRPLCEPEGMVKIGGKWRDIYEASAAIPIELEGSGLHVKSGKLQSKYGQLPVTGTEGANWFVFAELAALAGKHMMSYADWIAAARGNPEGEAGANNYGWTKSTSPANNARARTGCSVNAATGAFDDVAGIKPFAISAMNCVDCVGNVQEWLDELTYGTDTGSSGWKNVLGSGKGQAYLLNDSGLIALLAGGAWSNGVYAGARTVYANNYPWSVYTSNGVRLACDAA